MPDLRIYSNFHKYVICGNYVVLYKIRDEYVEIYRVMNRHQDITKIF